MSRDIEADNVLNISADGTVRWMGHKHRQNSNRARTSRQRGPRHNHDLGDAGTLAWRGRGHSRDIGTARMWTYRGHWVTKTWTQLKHGHKSKANKINIGY